MSNPDDGELDDHTTGGGYKKLKIFQEYTQHDSHRILLDIFSRLKVIIVPSL